VNREFSLHSGCQFGFSVQESARNTIMDISKISPGKNLPDEINVVIEIPQGSGAIKYEVDKDSGAVCVDRFLGTSMVYPANYGFVPNTLSDDGDPADVLVLSPIPMIPGCVVRCRPVGVLKMQDESGGDEKIVAVPVDKVTSAFKHVQNCADLPSYVCQQIEHFFSHYKDLESGKWVRIEGWGDREEAKQLLRDAALRVAKAA
jgi:inorganic pyrophosphatase